MINVLILSVGSRNKIIQYFRNELNKIGRVIAADCSNLAPAIYEADKYYITPKIAEDNYLQSILEICKNENINMITSLIDPELSYISKHKDEFAKLGVTILCPTYDLCELALDKFKMYQWLEKNNYNCAKSYTDIQKFLKDKDAGIIKYPVFVKPCKGSASISISKVYDDETLLALFKKENNLMIQEYLDGQEIGADVYVDLLSHEVVSIFLKKKLRMRAGETDKSVSFKDERLFTLVEKFVSDLGFTGQLDIDIFEVGGKYFISEVNPRFGGGYPHAYESGCNNISMIINNIQGKQNKKQVGMYKENVYMMKYNDVCILGL